MPKKPKLDSQISLLLKERWVSGNDESKLFMKFGSIKKKPGYQIQKAMCSRKFEARLDIVRTEH